MRRSCDGLAPRRGRRLLVVLTVGLTALPACSAAEQATASDAAPPQTATVLTERPSTSSAATPTSVPEPAPTTARPTAPPRQPLTGRPGGTREPVVALKIDNAVPARPQQGLGAADVVFEELVEGGTTRFLALFQSRLPDRIGPVRSGREVDAVLLPAFDPLLVFSGAADAVHRDIARAGLALVDDEAERFDAAFDRDDTRRAPYNLYLDAGGLRAALKGAPPAERPWAIGTATIKGQPLDGIELGFSPWASAAWSWDGEAWARAQDGAPHELVNGDVVRADNVVVMRVRTRPGGRTDAAGNPTVAIDVTGRGEALVLRDGRVHRGEWVKRDAENDLVWRAGSGRPLLLAPGSTWIELIPTDGDVDLLGAKREP